MTAPSEFPVIDGRVPTIMEATQDYFVIANSHERLTKEGRWVHWSECADFWCDRDSAIAFLHSLSPAGREGRDAKQDELAGRYWLLWFDDAERDSEVFADEAAARQRFKECSPAWHCKLFVQAPSAAPLAAHIKRLVDRWNGDASAIGESTSHTILGMRAMQIQCAAELEQLLAASGQAASEGEEVQSDTHWMYEWGPEAPPATVLR